MQLYGPGVVPSQVIIFQEPIKIELDMGSNRWEGFWIATHIYIIIPAMITII